MDHRQDESDSPRLNVTSAATVGTPHTSRRVRCDKLALSLAPVASPVISTQCHFGLSGLSAALGREAGPTALAG